jgi:hypothetical protein
VRIDFTLQELRDIYFAAQVGYVELMRRDHHYTFKTPDHAHRVNAAIGKIERNLPVQELGEDIGSVVREKMIYSSGRWDKMAANGAE